MCETGRGVVLIVFDCGTEQPGDNFLNGQPTIPSANHRNENGITWFQPEQRFQPAMCSVELIRLGQDVSLPSGQVVDIGFNASPRARSPYCCYMKDRFDPICRAQHT